MSDRKADLECTVETFAKMQPQPAGGRTACAALAGLLSPHAAPDDAGLCLSHDGHAVAFERAGDAMPGLPATAS